MFTFILFNQSYYTLCEKNNTEILISRKEGCMMDIRTCYCYCNIDNNNIITEIWKAFDYN